MKYLLQKSWLTNLSSQLYQSRISPQIAIQWIKIDEKQNKLIHPLGSALTVVYRYPSTKIKLHVKCCFYFLDKLVINSYPFILEEAMRREALKVMHYLYMYILDSLSSVERYTKAG